MFLEAGVKGNFACGFPRIRGDVPFLSLKPILRPLFSPHTRGCSVTVAMAILKIVVFPAYAGMFRVRGRHRDAVRRFPRIRGDVPQLTLWNEAHGGFSPHTRGCSLCKKLASCTRSVFPAYAGMFRPAISPTSGATGFPRIRGDVPRPAENPELIFWFSPHTRGCSFVMGTGVFVLDVFPAYAGMFLIRFSYSSSKACFPRIRGDVPFFVDFHVENRVFSPHTRGCSYSDPVGM